jgi:hypothetical protein
MIPEAAVAAVTPDEIARASDLFDVRVYLRDCLTLILTIDAGCQTIAH